MKVVEVKKEIEKIKMLVKNKVTDKETEIIQIAAILNLINNKSKLKRLN